MGCPCKVLSKKESPCEKGVFAALLLLFSWDSLPRICNMAVVRRRMASAREGSLLLIKAPFVQAFQKFTREAHLKRPILYPSRRAAHKCIDLYG